MPQEPRSGVTPAQGMDCPEIGHPAGSCRFTPHYKGKNMPERFVEVYEEAGTSTITTLSDFEISSPGTPSATQEVQIWNDKGGTNAAADETGLKLRVLAKEESDAEFSFDNTASKLGFIECRIVSGLNFTASPTGWIKASPGFPLNLPTLESDQGVVVQFRANTPSYVPSQSVAVKILLVDDLSVGFSNYKAGTTGFKSDKGIQGRTKVTYFGGTVEEDPGGASNDVFIPDLEWVENGVPYRKIEHLETIGTTDKNAATPGVGEFFYVYLYLLDGDIEIEKGEKGAAPDLPDAVDGIILALLQVDDTGNIADADIQNYIEYQSEFVFSSSGLDASFSGGTCIVGESLVEINGNLIVTLNASATNIVAMNVDGGLVIADSENEVSGFAEPIAKFVTDGSGVTSFKDLKKDVMFPAEKVKFNFASPSVNDYAYAAFTENRRAYVKEISISVFPDSGTTSGGTKVDIFYLDSGLSWQSIFPSSGTEDKRPFVAYNAAYPISKDSFHEVCIIEGMTNLRAEVISLPGSGTIDHIEVTMKMEVI